ncbi:unnamed protein product [Adineta ricciae]|uniref:Uncharacterized protein n=1 Tax=Adineta ricciae TaxID=249248 RepID=A0A814RLG3_ADIRI|nr:unnamed protein product [Adineta ricciae]CAF1608916.1 unnamed protein product [Adineta ricciae]
MRQRELRSKLHKTRYAQSLRQTNGSPTMYDSPSSRRTPIPSPHIPMPPAPLKNNGINQYDDENESLFSELRLSSIPGSNFSQNDARLPPQVPAPPVNKFAEPKFNGTKNTTTHVPTTLSIEERRVQESIDRLDRQLKEAQAKIRPNSGTRLPKTQKR